MKEKVLELIKALPVEYTPMVPSHDTVVIQEQLANAEKCLRIIRLVLELPQLVVYIQHGQPSTSVKYNPDKFIFEITSMSGLDSYSTSHDMSRTIEYLESEILNLSGLLSTSQVIKEATSCA